MALFAVVHKAGLERRLNAGDHRFVNVAFALFAPFDFDFVVEQFLPVNNGQAALFGLRGVNQHAFHESPLMQTTSPNGLTARAGLQAANEEELPESAGG